MKNKGGFTLVELLATIAILAILAVVATVSVESILNRGKNESVDIQNELVEAAAKQYAVDNLNVCSISCSISIGELISQGYMNEDKSGNLNMSEVLYITMNKDKFVIEKSNKLKDKILGINNENVINKAPNFNKTTSTDNGIYKSTDAQGTTYYFRGAVTNNYVQFANMIWRIVRINGDGSIRIILEENAGDKEYGAITYSGSALENAVNTWYNDKIGNNSTFDSKVTNGLFCNDTSDDARGAYKRLYTDKNPSFVCNSTPITAKAALINGDEVMFAGSLVCFNRYNFTSYIFEGGKNSWIMTPWNNSFQFQIYSNPCMFNSNPTLVQNNYRPVINLQSSVKAGGVGTKNSPYIIL